MSYVPDATTDDTSAVPPAAEVFYQDHDFDEVIPIDWTPESSQWPPPNFYARNRIFARLKGLRAGNLGLKRGAFGTKMVTLNEFERHALRLAYLLAMGRPTVGGEPIGTVQAVEWIDDMATYGGAIIAWIDDGFEPIEPGDWYPREGGGSVTAVPWHTGKEHHADRIEVTQWWDDRQVSISQHSYDGHGQIGNQIDEEETAEGMLVAAPAPPCKGHTRQWGSTKFFALFPLVLEISRRMSKNSNIYDLYSAPIPVFDQSDADARRRFGVPNTATDDEADEMIEAGYSKLLASVGIRVPGDILKLSLLQPNVQGANYALQEIIEYRDQCREISGVPDLTGRTLSGEALKRLFVNFYAESDTYLDSATEAIEEASGLPAIWPHPFDAGMFDAATTGPPRRGAETIPTADPDPEPGDDA